jgi:hypothetical protein
LCSENSQVFLEITDHDLLFFHSFRLFQKLVKQHGIATRNPGDLSYGQLKLMPFWDPLRSDPRFDKIVASLAPKDQEAMKTAGVSQNRPTSRGSD